MNQLEHLNDALAYIEDHLERSIRTRQPALQFALHAS